MFFTFLCYLSFVGDECFFAFFIEWATVAIDLLGIDLLGMLCYPWMRCVMEDGGWQV